MAVDRGGGRRSSGRRSRSSGGGRQTKRRGYGDIRDDRDSHDRVESSMRTAGVISALFLVCAGVLGAQSVLERPQPGIMLDRAGTARPLYGIAGSITAGDPLVTGATALACSERVCLVKTESALFSLARSANGFIDAPHGPAVLALDGDAAFVYFSQSSQLMRWRSGQLEPGELPVPEAALAGDAIVSLRVRKGALEFAVVREDGTWIVRSDGRGGDFVTGETGAVLLRQHGVVFATDGGVVLRRSDGTEVRFDVAGVDGLFEFGPGYVEARTADAVYAIRIEPGREQMFLLPENQ